MVTLAELGELTCNSSGMIVRMAKVPTDIWFVDVDGIWLENGPNGWRVISHPVARERLTLLVRDIPVGGFRADPAEARRFAWAEAGNFADGGCTNATPVRTRSAADGHSVRRRPE